MLYCFLKAGLILFREKNESLAMTQRGCRTLFMRIMHGYKIAVQKFTMHSELNIVHRATKNNMKREINRMAALASTKLQASTVLVPSSIGPLDRSIDR